MRGATYARWVVSAVAVALTATACGGGSDGGTSGSHNSGIFSASWGDPQKRSSRRTQARRWVPRSWT